MNIAPSQHEIFKRNLGVLTAQAQQLLHGSAVAIAGLGGLGGTTAEVLARLGIGHLRLADFDRYDVHNINRQIGATTSTVGELKTDVMARRVRDINPNLRVDTLPEGVTVENAPAFVESADVIVDAVDFFQPAARAALHREARRAGRHVLLTPAAGFGAMLLLFAPDGPALEDVFGPVEGDQDAVADLRRMAGLDLTYLPELFYECPVGPSPYVSTNSPGNFVAGALTAVQVLRTLMWRRRRERADAFAEYGPIELVTVPRATRLDVWSMEYCATVELELRPVS
jgi:molybdopterin/thiamine biosynthesis adenylyltransferase